MRALRATIAGVTITMSVVAGCGGGDDDSSSDPPADQQTADVSGGDEQPEQTSSDEDVSINLEDDDGDVSMNIGGDLPDDFPLPVPDGMTVAGSYSAGDDAGTSYNVVLTAPKEDFDSIADFYEGVLDDGDFEVTRQNVEGDGAKVVYLYGTSAEAEVIISVSVDDATSETAVTLTWGPAT